MTDDAAEQLPARVAEALHLDSRSGERLTGGRVSRFWKSSRGGRAVAVRQSPQFRTLAEVAYEWALLHRLHDVGAPVAQPLANPVTVDDHVWVAFEWIAGSHPTSPVEDPAAYGEFLATLHEFTMPLANEFGQRSRWGRVDQFMNLPRDQSGLTFSEVLPEFEAAMGERERWLGGLARAIDERLAAFGPAELPGCVAHGDFGPHQILVDTAGRFAAIIDWDFTHLDLRAADVGIGSSLARPTLARAVRLLEGYLRGGQLDPTELRLLPDLRRAFHLNSLAGHVCWRWRDGHDITPALAAITERLEREEWWGPVLLEATKALDRRSTETAPPVYEEADDLSVAHELADRAAVVASHFFGRGVVTQDKADMTPVTEADRAVEILLREALSQLRPGDSILGEELGRRGESDRTWILDPIDGTASFARGDPNWRIQIALQEGGRITVAVVDSPALGVRWWASAGDGAYESRTVDDGPRRLQVSETQSLDGARVDTFPGSLAVRLPAGVMTPPSGRLPLADLLRGEIDAYFVDCCGPWDHAPWILMVQEAGGKFTDHDGGSDPGRSGGLYSNGHIHAALLAGLGVDP